MKRTKRSAAAACRGPSAITRHPLLPAHARLPRPLPARLVDAQAEGNAPRTGRAAVGGTGRPVAGKAREPASAVGVGVSDGGVARTGEEPHGDPADDAAQGRARSCGPLGQRPGGSAADRIRDRECDCGRAPCSLRAAGGHGIGRGAEQPGTGGSVCLARSGAIAARIGRRRAEGALRECRTATQAGVGVRDGPITARSMSRF